MSIISNTITQERGGRATVKFSINITPKPAPRPRVNPTSHKVYVEKWYLDYREEIARQANPYLLNYTTSDPVELRVRVRKQDNIRYKRYGDADNLLKGVMDALIGYAYKDDAQIVKATVEKVQSENEGFDIELIYLTEE